MREIILICCDDNKLRKSQNIKDITKQLNKTIVQEATSFD